MNIKNENGAASAVEGAPKCLARIFSDSIARNKNAVAFDDGQHTYQFGQVGQLAESFAHYLKETVGVLFGDRVALMAPNVIEFPVVSIAIAWVGGVQVNINPLYTERELLHQIEDAGVEVLVIHEMALSTFQNIASSCGVKRLIIIEDTDSRGVCSVEVSGVVVDSAKSILQSRETFDLHLRADDSNAIAMLQYTGGTTGLSKGAVLKNINVATNSAQVRLALSPPLAEGECIVTALPLYHIFAFTVNFVTFFSLGGKNLLIKSAGDLDAMIGVMSGQKVTAMTGVNTLYAHLVAHPDISSIDWGNFKIAIGGGSAILPSTSNKWKELTGSHILEGYGMTETSPVLTTNLPYDEGFSGTVGVPLPLTEVAIFDSNDRRLGVNEEGEICVKGPQMMAEYWGNELATKEIFNREGFLRTGDIGIVDTLNRVKIIDRKKDMILVSGFNVFPNEVEEIVGGFEGVLECACVGGPDERAGEKVMIYLVLEDPQRQIDIDELVSHCRASLAAYKVPKEVYVVDELPKSTVGKILRRELRRKRGASTS